MGKKFLVIILIVVLLVMGVVTYKLYNEKEECAKKIENFTKENEIEQVLIEGSYAPDASDIGFRFDKNGNAFEVGNVHKTKGTYKTIAENLIEIKFTETTVCDLDTGKETVRSDVRTVLIKYLSDDELFYLGESEEECFTMKKYEVNE